MTEGGGAVPAKERLNKHSGWEADLAKLEEEDVEHGRGHHICP